MISWTTFSAGAVLFDFVHLDNSVPILFTLTKTYEEDRQVKDAKQCYLGAMQRDALYCVWCESRLTTQNLAIDHLLPFAQTQNNNLWNLVPSCKKCNSNKSDGIPTPETIERRKERILECWQREQADHPEAFEQEIRYDLVGFEEPAFVAETSLQYLSKRCDFLIQERGYNSWNRK